MEFFYWTALSVGFLGSFHCAGMCGPIALALPGGEASPSRLLFTRLLYNSGRIFTYSILGMMAGLFGRTFSIRGWQSDLSILSGALILVFVLLTNQGIQNRISQRFSGASHQLKKSLGALLKKHSLLSMFGIGALNGILPCGFVYLALAGAATGGGLAEGALYMALFGAGTVPMMLILSLSGSLISSRARAWVNRLSPVIAVALAIFLIQRGAMMKESEQACCKPKSAQVSGL
ncbi:MAG: sulfite exporter TauE/SafE family protein [Bacteroidia bacterium]|nr:sulfite exporter TauE/SafE family protein [Bacteroidia bacterium]